MKRREPHFGRSAQLISALFAATLALAPARSLSEESAGVTNVESADAASERMFNALGGRARWAALTSLVNDSWQHRIEPPHTVRARISMDLTSPRWRIETTAPDLHLIRVWDDARKQGWRLSRSGQIENLPEATRDEDLRWHRGHVYRTLHRLAAREAGLSARMADGRLEVMEGQQRIAWFQLSGNGEPYAFGALDDETGSRSGPWSFDQDGLRHPTWVANASGSWRANIHALATNVALDDDVFARPKFLAGLPALHGSWAGMGDFQGRSAAMSLAIDPILSGAFTQWQLEISVDQQPLFAGLLHARRDFDGLQGDWRDSSGDRLLVRTEFVGDCLYSDWQKGRSRYCLIGAHQLRVEDYPMSGETPFARYMLKRSEP